MASLSSVIIYYGQFHFLFPLTKIHCPKLMSVLTFSFDMPDPEFPLSCGIMEQEVMGSGARHDAQTKSSRKTMKGNSARANTHVRKDQSGCKKVLKKRKKAKSALTISKNKIESPYAAKVREMNEKTLTKLKKAGLFMPPPSREEVLASVLSGPDHYFQICTHMENDFMDGEEDTEFNEGLFLETQPVSSDEEENSDTEDGKKQP